MKWRQPDARGDHRVGALVPDFINFLTPTLADWADLCTL
jgi:hypothetical protein